ncbi:FecR family protein [Chitinophaga jiangningensis]|uniref:FecR family protein n=1 Tax=Chitinophaga jiangningensis TaxID=1419482 RepID=A0A1M7K5H8_9BACT|nr:FecR family protein [Chitinophaga jiangningensis]SHM60087.1 FecR family protein [Chitinophaga jiangningensis]
MPTGKNNEYYRLLLQRWQQRKCSPQEAIELLDYLSLPEADRLLLAEIQAAFEQSAPDTDISGPGDRVRQALFTHIQSPAPIIPLRKNGKLRFLAAAAVLAAIAIPAAKYLLPEQKPVITKAISQDDHDISPGKNKAVLTLANGEKIVLDSAGNQLLASQGGSAIRNHNGELRYDDNGHQPPVYNTLTTAAGETYTLTLADGTKVWLNAASSIRFPSAFPGSERLVELTGEAYFEVAANANKAFRIHTGKIAIDVLGTSLNVNAYTTAATTNTTLISGAVKVNSSSGSLLLAPGEQSQVSANGHQTKQTNVNISSIIAWKDGFFQFENTPLTEVLQQFAQWYNVEIVYEGKVNNRKFFGIINRNSTLKNVLRILDANDISFRLEGNKLIVQHT